MLPAVTCVLLAQMAAAAVTAPTPWPAGWDTRPVKVVRVDWPQVRPAPQAQLVCPFRMRVADPSLDPGMAWSDDSQALDGGVIRPGCRPLNVETER